MFRRLLDRTDFNISYDSMFRHGFLLKQPGYSLKNRSQSIVLNHLNTSITEHNQTRWYKDLIYFKQITANFLVLKNGWNRCVGVLSWGAQVEELSFLWLFKAMFYSKVFAHLIDSPDLSVHVMRDFRELLTHAGFSCSRGLDNILGRRRLYFHALCVN